MITFIKYTVKEPHAQIPFIGIGATPIHSPRQALPATQREKRLREEVRNVDILAVIAEGNWSQLRRQQKGGWASSKISPLRLITEIMLT